MECGYQFSATPRAYPKSRVTEANELAKRVEDEK